VSCADEVLVFNMANLTTIEKQILEKLFQMSGGYVLNFSDRTIREFFKDDIGIDIYDEKYNYASGSKANRIRHFWSIADNKLVGKSILKLVEYIESQILLENLSQSDFTQDLINEVKKIGQKFFGGDTGIEKISEANFSDSTISIVLQKEVFDHVKSLLKSGHYFNAVEESYKIVREKLKLITGREKAHEAFSEDNYEKIFGHKSRNDAEKDFFEGVKFLHMAIQKLRNEKAHTPAKELDRNLAIHYIVLASLAYDLVRGE
jgi:uncharacterized protein (TIGR02391 family)